jgi:hypothetical protein
VCSGVFLLLRVPTKHRFFHFNHAWASKELENLNERRTALLVVSSASKNQVVDGSRSVLDWIFIGNRAPLKNKTRGTVIR